MKSSVSSLRNYGRLKELLESQEQFPLLFSFKVIGRNSPAFNESVEAFQRQIPALKRTSSRESAEGAHLSVTYEILAQSSAEIIWAYEQASSIQDVKILL